MKGKIGHYFNKASVFSLTVKEIGSQDQACQECLCKQIVHTSRILTNVQMKNILSGFPSSS